MTLRLLEAEVSDDMQADRLAEVKAVYLRDIHQCEERITTLNVGNNTGKGEGKDGCQNTATRGSRGTCRHAF